MRSFVRTEIPRDFDPRLVNVLRNLHGYLEQVDKGFGRIQRGEKPVAGSALPSQQLIDESKFVLLAGRNGGQSVKGSPSAIGAVSGTVLNLAAFNSASSASIALDNAAVIIEGSTVTMRAPSHDDEPLLMGFSTSGSPVQNWVGISVTGSIAISASSAAGSGFSVLHGNLPTTSITAFVQKRAAQTGNLFEWRSGASPMSYIRASDGAFVGPVVGTTGFFEKLRIGDATAPTHRLEIVAGSTTVAPILLTSGPLLTTPVVGTLEFLDDTIFFTTTTGPARKLIMLKTNSTPPSANRVAWYTNGNLSDSASFQYNDGTKIVTVIGQLQTTGASANIKSFGTLSAVTKVNFGSGVADAVSKVQSDYIDTSTGAVNIAGVASLLRVQNVSSSAANFIGMDGLTYLTGAVLSATGVAVGAVGLRGGIIVNNSVTTPSVTGLTGLIYTEGGTPTLTSAYNIATRWAHLNGTITNAYGFYGSDVTGGGAVTNNYLLYLESPTAGGTSNWAIYSAGGPSSLAGTLRIGDNTAPTHRLELVAGTTAIAPLRLTSGTSLTTPASGVIEMTTDDLFFTITTGAARKAFVLDDGTRLTSGRIPFATTNGRLIDDADFTFATDTLTITKIAATTLIGTLTFADAIDIAFNTGTGTKIGTAASQKLGFWNTAPIVQPTTGVAAATFVTNTSGILDDSATFDGYTIGQVVKALRNVGLLT